MRDSQVALIETLRIELERLATFHSALIIYLQQITPYVDSKDYEFDGLATRRVEDVGEAVETLHHRTVGPGGAISGVGDELNRRLEMLAVRERRYRGARRRPRCGARAARAVARCRHARDADVEARGRAPRRSGTGNRGREPGTGSPAEPARRWAPKPLRRRRARPSTPPTPSRRGGIESFKYVGFEDQFRGSTTVIRERLQDYLPLFAGQQDVLDIGCGRGEFLDLLRQQGIRARGLDINHEMVEECRQRGLDASEGDALALPAGPRRTRASAASSRRRSSSTCEPDYLVRLLQRAGEVLRPGGVLALETVNVACWFAFFQSYVRDITHVRPLHPETLAYFVRASGFPHVDVQYRSPYPEAHKLQHVPGGEALHYTVNANVDKLNSLLFTHLDYAVIARKP